MRSNRVTARHAPVRGVAVRAVAILSVMVIVACGDLAHTNPYDPVTPVSLAVVGTDTVTASGDTLRFALAATPSLDPGIVNWSVAGPYATWLEDIGGGNFRVSFPQGLEAAPRQITVKGTLVDGRSAQKTIVAYHRASALRLANCWYGYGLDLTYDALGDSTFVCAALVDRRGQPVSTLDPLQVQSRNSAMTRATTKTSTTLDPAGPSAWVAALDTGVTSVVFTRGAFRDSVIVTDRQVLAFLAPFTPCVPQLTLPKDSTVQLVALPNGRDSHNYPLKDTTGLAAAVATTQYTGVYYSFGPTVMSVTPGGRVTGLAPGSGGVVGSFTFRGIRSSYAYCQVYVPYPP